MELTDGSYAVLVLAALRGPSTAYDLERAVEHLAAEFWSVPHTQVYRECDRLVRAGLLSADQESGGRRRRVFTLTEDGSARVREWVRTPTTISLDIRDVASLKLLATEMSTTGDVKRLARAQVEAYEERLQRLRETEARFAGRSDVELRMLSIPMGRAVYEAALTFWKRIESDPPDVESWGRAVREQRKRNRR